MSNFEIEISGEAGSYRVAARSDAGDTEAVAVSFPFDELTLDRELNRLETALAWSAAAARRSPSKDERPAQEFGRQLFEFVLPLELRANLIASRQNAADRDVPFRVRLRIGPPELAALPWEFLYDPTKDDYLSLSTPLVRYLDVFEPRRPLAVAPPLRILAMIARPDGLESLDVEHEKRRLTQALAHLERSGRVQLSWVQGQTWWNLQDDLDRGAWHIFHFIGHGGFDRQSGEGLLTLTGEDGEEHHLPASDLAPLLAEHRSMRLVVLNSCDTARASATDRFSSTASVLMRRGIPAVVAMQYKISDPAAVSFARGFYTAVAAQHPIDQAVTRGRRAIKMARQNTLEWATPVLYLRSPTGVLFDLADMPDAPAVPRLPDRTPADQQAVPALATGPGEATPAPPPRSANQIAPPAHTSTVRSTSQVHPAASKQSEGKLAELARMTHGGPVKAVVFSPDGTRLASASEDKTARLWDPATGQELGRLTHDIRVWAVVFSPDGTRLAIAGGGDTTRVWDPATGHELAWLTDGQVVVFSPDGTRLATGSSDGTAGLWDPATGKQLARLTHDSRVWAVVFSPDGTRLATASGDKTARLWNPATASVDWARLRATGQQLARLNHDDIVWNVVFSPDGTRLATASRDGTARVWDAANGKELTRMTHDGSVNRVTFCPDGTRLATASGDKTARVWDAATGKQLTRMTHDSDVRGVVFSPDGTLVATASSSNTSGLWDPATGQQLARLTHRREVNAVVFSPDGTRLASASGDRTARIWALNLE